MANNAEQIQEQGQGVPIYDSSLGLDELGHGCEVERVRRIMHVPQSQCTHYDEDWEPLTDEEISVAQSACGATNSVQRQTGPESY